MHNEMNDMHLRHLQAARKHSSVGTLAGTRRMDLLHAVLLHDLGTRLCRAGRAAACGRALHAP